MFQKVLSERLQRIYDLARVYDSVLDVGADHGNLAINLKRNNLKMQVYASEKNEGPFINLNKNIKEAGLDIMTSQIDGLLNAPSVDLVIIAGMGGNLIKKILDDGREYLKNNNSDLILEPQSNFDVVRKELHSQGYRIDDEFYVREKQKFYPIICCRKGEECHPYTEEDYIYGHIPLKNRDEVLLEKINKTILNLKNKSNNPQVKTILYELCNLKERYFK